MPSSPRPLPLAGSLVLHGLALGWLVWGPSHAAGDASRSLYAQVIAPHESKLVWYTFRQKLPDVAPTERRGPAGLPEAELRTPGQEIAARPPDAPHARQMIWEPAPKIKITEDVPSPNLLVMGGAPAPPQPPPQPRRLLLPPVPERAPAPVAAIEAPPQLAAAANPARNPLQPEIARPQPRQFVLVEKPAPPKASPLLALPPELTAGAREQLPVASVEGLAGAPPKVPPRAFVPPPEVWKTTGASGPAALPEAPRLAGVAPETDVQRVIVGLTPADRPPIAPPEGERRAQFSAGPEVRTRTGAADPSSAARIAVPDLVVRGGGAVPRPIVVAPTSQANLASALHMIPPRAPAPGGGPVTAEPPPDPSFAGRMVYRLAIQMPNVTSYSGSWTIWFAERQTDGRLPESISLPVPLHKVDPKYYPSAIEDRVEGKVRLRAVLRSDGHVEDLVLTEKLDDRLDHSALEALRRWEFAPAKRNGSAVAVDMVVEIPFRLRPEKEKK